MDDKQRFDNGMAKRRKTLGNEWVDKSVKTKTSFNGNSSTSSPATPGATCGSARISTTAPAASW